MRTSKYTKEILQPLVAQAYSKAELLRLLGLKITGGNYRMIQQRLDFYEMSTKHFTGQLWSKGKTKLTHPSLLRKSTSTQTPDEQVFKSNSTFQPSKLRHRLIKLGVTYQCSICRLEDWMGNPITLHVDHINGKHSDNTFENLRFLCPNCHQQTSTWGSRKK